MNFIFGLIISFVCFALASQHLNQGWQNYYDFVALAVVIGGTFSVLFITRPKKNIKFIMEQLYNGVLKNKKDKFNFAEKCFGFSQNRKSDGFDTNNIEEKILVDGLEMIDLGFEKEKIESILSDRYLTYKKSGSLISAWIKRCAKYPPAFGLGGTVLGLIHLMNGLAQGSNPKETGVRMAVALVATFYGLILSNVILNPLSEAIIEKIKSDEDLVEMSLKTVLNLKDNYNDLEMQESLNSFLVDEKKKIDFMSNPMDEAA